jgi:hypothetical protein
MLVSECASFSQDIITDPNSDPEEYQMLFDVKIRELRKNLENYFEKKFSEKVGNLTSEDAKFMERFESMRISISNPKPTRKGLSVNVTACPIEIQDTTQTSAIYSTGIISEFKSIPTDTPAEESRNGGIGLMIFLICLFALFCCIFSFVLYQKN